MKCPRGVVLAIGLSALAGCGARGGSIDRVGVYGKSSICRCWMSPAERGWFVGVDELKQTMITADNFAACRYSEMLRLFEEDAWRHPAAERYRCVVAAAGRPLLFAKVELDESGGGRLSVARASGDDIESLVPVEKHAAAVDAAAVQRVRTALNDDEFWSGPPVPDEGLTAPENYTVFFEGRRNSLRRVVVALPESGERSVSSARRACATLFSLGRVGWLETY